MMKYLPSRTAQWPLMAHKQFALTDMATTATGGKQALNVAGTATLTLCTLPVFAIVTSVTLSVLTANDDSGTATAQIKLGGTAVGGAVNTKTLGPTTVETALAPTTEPTDLTVDLLNTNGDGTVGDVLITVTYLMDNRANETYPMGHTQDTASVTAPV